MKLPGHTPAPPGSETTRRDFLAFLLAAAAGGALPAGCAPPVAKNEGMAGRMLDAVADRGAATRFGRAYLEAYPAESDPGLLLQILERTVLADATERPRSAEAVFALVDAVVRGEYAHGEVIRADGWLVSRSEARLYALSLLLRDK